MPSATPQRSLRALEFPAPSLLLGLLVVLVLAGTAVTPGGADNLRDTDWLTCDVPYTGSIAALGESDQLLFSVAEGERISLTIKKGEPSDPDFWPMWRLLRSDGSPDPQCGGWSTESGADCGPLPASGSPYRLELGDYLADHTGTYRVRLQRRTSEQACDGSPLICDQVTEGVISDPIDSDFLSFNVAEDERVSITIVKGEPSDPDFWPMWRLLRGDGSLDPQCGGWSTEPRVDCGPLPASGNPYRLELRDYLEDHTGTYRVRLQRLPAAQACESAVLLCDQVLTGVIDDPIDTDLIVFGATNGERVSLTITWAQPSDPGFYPVWRLLRGDGSPDPRCGAWNTEARADCGPLSTSEGPYRIEIGDHMADQTGTYLIHMQRLSATEPCETIPLACDQLLTGIIDDPVDTDLIGFNATDGEQIMLTIAPTDSSDPNFVPVWRLLNGDGSPSASCGAWNTVNRVDCGPLPGSGNPYRIELGAWGALATGSYRVELQRLPFFQACESRLLTCDTELTGSIDDPLDSDLMRILVGDNDIFTLQVEAVPGSGPDFYPVWRLLGSDGLPAISCGAWTSVAVGVCGPFPISGNPYRLQVANGSLIDTGSYRVIATDCASNAGVESGEIVPAEFGLRCVSPNPVRAGDASLVEFELAIPRTSLVALEMFDSAGRLAGTLLQETLGPGIHRIPLNDERLSSGVYYVRLRSEHSRATTRLVVVR